MKTFIFTCLSLALVFFSGCSDDNPAGADKDDGNADTKILGTVIQTGANARVLLTQGRIVDSTVSSSADGLFEFDSVQPGNYVIKVTAENYDTFYINVKIEEGNAVYVGAVFMASKISDPGPAMDTIPSVWDHYPKDKAEVVFNPYTYYTGGNPPRLYISMSFDRPMDRESVVRALKIDPPVQGYIVWSQNRQTYNVPETYGMYEWRGLALYDTASVTYGYAAPAAPATITTYQNVQSFTYYFNLSDCYTDTTYTITLSREALDTGGAPLDSAHEFSFSTVQSATAYDDVTMDPHSGEDYVDLMRSQGIIITFPKRMDQASVEAHLSMLPLDTDAILIWNDYNKLTLVTSGRILVPDTTYVITIDSAALDADGKPLGETKVLTFSTRSVMVKSTVPSHGDMMVEPWDTILVTFNTYMDKNSLPGRIFLVSGAGDTIPGIVDYYHYTNYYSGTVWVKERIMFDPAVTLAYDEKYTLYIAPGVTDRRGFPMRQGYQLVFVTMP